MNRLIAISLILVLFIVSSVSQSGEGARSEFTKAYCDPSRNSESCLCEAQVWYDNLTDEQKGFIQAGLEIMHSNTELSNSEISEIINNTYDPGGRIQKELDRMKPKIDKMIRSRCR